mgnify:FL=1
MSNGVLNGADDLAVAIVADYVCDVVVFVEEKFDCHRHKRRNRLDRRGEFRLFVEFFVKFVFEFFKSESKKMIFVFKVCVESGSVDHSAIAKVDDADFLDRFFFHHIEQSVAQKFSCANDAQIFFVCHI